ncbi:zinc-binding dehydrogenase [Algoriphagus namhaensis]|uniref:Zinc-binding dehydrogenase n=1 Tax=Algoriphagus namhaensis TaxID=915353 RepID=A0ABV8AWY1_9BACT
MRAITLNRALPDKIELKSVSSKAVGAKEVLVKIKAAALNHRDEWARKGLYPNLRDGVILGSDGAGIVKEAGDQVSKDWIGKEVIINPSINWGNDQKAQSADFEILGIPRDGTLAENVLVPADRLHEKPAHLNWEEAAALPLAGLTAFRALFYRAGLIKGQKVLVTGFGGGVAQFATQFAIAAEGEVYVSSSSPAKIEKARSLGAKAGFDYRDANWVNEAKSIAGGFDVIIDGAAGDSFSDLLKVCNTGGTVVFYGATGGNPSQLDARRIFWNQLNIKGSTMGSDQDFLEMLEFVSKHRIKPLVDQVFSFEEAVTAFDRMRDGKQLGKIVLKP